MMERTLRYLAGIGLLAIAAVHLDLYLRSGYRNIPTIGRLFLFNVVAAVALGVAVVVAPRVELTVSAALFSLGTFGGYLLSAWVGLFGFKETGNVLPAVLAGVAEVATFVLLGAWTILHLRAGGGPRWLTRRWSHGAR
jgi:hypothetical protein